MTRHDSPRIAQLGFDALLTAADTENRTRKFERETAHLPGTMDRALPFYRALIDRHHAAMLAANVDEAMGLRDEAHKLALRLNAGELGILASLHEQEDLHRLHEELKETQQAREEAQELSVTFNDAAEFAEGPDRAGEDDDDRSPSWKTRAEETRRGKGYGYRRGED